jgi:hypothetical protein
MAYIGNKPTVGNFQICDAISVVNNQAAYTMQVGSVNVIPQSANHMIVSLNGVIQAPNSSYTVSGSTITFAANLVTGDGINVIQILGDVLDLGVPSDATVTSAKVADNAITLAKMASGTDGNIISYDASGNPVAVATGNDGQVLTSTGAGSPPAFETLPVGGITNAQQWRISASQSNMDIGDHITNNWEQADSYGYGGIGSAMSQSSGIFTFPSTGTWLVQFTINGNDSTSQLYIGGQITATTNNSTYNVVAAGNNNITSGDQYFTHTINHMFNVSSTSTHKVRFAISGQNNGMAVSGSTNRTDTGAVFIRLGDST